MEVIACLVTPGCSFCLKPLETQRLFGMTRLLNKRWATDFLFPAWKHRHKPQGYVWSFLGPGVQSIQTWTPKKPPENETP